jgi:hypothetical protein
MTTVQPGWYPDPENPTARVRWYDGAGWTETTSPAPAAETPAWQQPAVTAAAAPAAWPPAPIHTRSNTAVIIVAAVGGVFALGITSAIAIPVFLNQRAKAETAALSTVTCESLGAEAVATSQSGVVGDEIPLTSVSGLMVERDDRATLRRPQPGGQAFVLSCAGTALWQDGVTTPVVVRLDVDATLEHVVSFTWTE